jgi:hypothetical protein
MHNVHQKSPKFTVLGVGIEEVSILRLEIVDLLAIRAVPAMGSYLDGIWMTSLPTWCQTFKQLPHSNLLFMGFSEVHGATFHFNEKIGMPCMVSDPTKIQRTDIEVLTHLV